MMTVAVEKWSFKKELAFLNASTSDPKRDAESKAIESFLTKGPTTIRVLKTLYSQKGEFTWAEEASMSFIDSVPTTIVPASEVTLSAVGNILAQLVLVNVVQAAPDVDKSFKKAEAWLKSLSNLSLAELPPQIKEHMRQGLRRTRRT